jgi:hypothetical protein
VISALEVLILYAALESGGKSNKIRFIHRGKNPMEVLAINAEHKESTLK